MYGKTPLITPKMWFEIRFLVKVGVLHLWIENPIDAPNFAIV